MKAISPLAEACNLDDAPEPFYLQIGAFELVARFDATDLLDPLIEASFKSLVSSGRIATLEEIARQTGNY